MLSFYYVDKSTAVREIAFKLVYMFSIFEMTYMKVIQVIYDIISNLFYLNKLILIFSV